jgi:hypothetical protein
MNMRKMAHTCTTDISLEVPNTKSPASRASFLAERSINVNFQEIYRGTDPTVSGMSRYSMSIAHI